MNNFESNRTLLEGKAPKLENGTKVQNFLVKSFGGEKQRPMGQSSKYDEYKFFEVYMDHDKLPEVTKAFSGPEWKVKETKTYVKIEHKDIKYLKVSWDKPKGNPRTDRPRTLINITGPKKNASMSVPPAWRD